jgi:hypothetical protein
MAQRLRASAMEGPETALATRRCQRTITASGPDGKAMLPEPRSVQKANSYQ